MKRSLGDKITIHNGFNAQMFQNCISATSLGCFGRAVVLATSQIKFQYHASRAKTEVEGFVDIREVAENFVG